MTVKPLGRNAISKWNDRFQPEAHHRPIDYVAVPEANGRKYQQLKIIDTDLAIEFLVRVIEYVGADCDGEVRTKNDRAHTYQKESGFDEWTTNKRQNN